MTNLVETILSSLPANTVDSLGSSLGENPDNTLKGLAGVLPLVLSAFASKASAGQDLGGLVSMIKGALAGGNPLDNPVGLLANTSPATGIGGFATQLLGPKMGAIAPAVASYFGLKGGSVNSLLALAGPLIAGGIGKVLGANPSVDSVRNLLVSEKHSYETALPAELRRLAVAAPSAAYTPPPAAPEEEPSGAWKWWLLGLALLGLLAWLFFGRTPKPEPVVPADTVVAEDVVVPDPVVIPTGAGVLGEERDGKPVLVVFFDVAKSEVSNNLSAESAAVKAYLDANPSARLSVSGFNDPTGNAAANAELSKNRAEAVKAALVNAGFAADRIDLDKPVASTDTSDSYAAARRVEVTIKD